MAREENVMNKIFFLEIYYTALKNTDIIVNDNNLSLIIKNYDEDNNIEGLVNIFQKRFSYNNFKLLINLFNNTTRSGSIGTICQVLYNFIEYCRVISNNVEVYY